MGLGNEFNLKIPEKQKNCNPFIERRIGLGNQKVCDKNCFSCTYADCIYDGLDYEDYKAERELDLVSGAKELAGSPKARAAKRKYYEENRDKVAAAKRKYREENRDKVAAAQRKYREENREKMNANSRSYYQQNKEKWAKYRQNRMAKLQGGNANG